MLRLLFASVLVCALASSARAENCVASWYGAESGPRTANGERFRPDGVSCAHRTRPFGEVVTIRDLRSGRSIQCRINDRGPAKWTRRCIDLSHGAARALGMGGTARVSIE
jgi:rare lipoprotein A